jgi:cellulose synthase (UDP-forming)
MSAPRTLLVAGWQRARRRLALLIPLDLLLSVWYFTWLLSPRRIGNPVLYGLLVAAEAFNLIQAAGFWWTISRARERRPLPPMADPPPVDVLIPVYNEEPTVVEHTLAAACRLDYPNVSVFLCDDGDSDEMATLAARYGAGYLRRADHRGAKAGNLNNALRRTNAPLVAVFDSDHVPDPRFLLRTVGYFSYPTVGLVQTPQYYANAGRNPVAAAAWSQQALFFGVIARGKGALDSMFCCGTNVVFRRAALQSVGGIPEESITEDFEISIHLRERGWRTEYVPEILASGLGPEDMASYVSQQKRWSRGCLSALSTAARSRLPFRQKAQFLLSSLFFLTGWTYLIYMALPVVRILGGQQALASATAAQFLAHFAPYFCASMLTVAVAGQGCYSFAGFALMEASFWIHVSSTLRTLFGMKTSFIVTPKVGKSGRQPSAVWPSLVALIVLGAAAADGLIRSRSPATLNNVAFALLHITVLLVGIWPALAGIPRSGPELQRAEAIDLRAVRQTAPRPVAAPAGSASTR